MPYTECHFLFTTTDAFTLTFEKQPGRHPDPTDLVTRSWIQNRLAGQHAYVFARIPLIMSSRWGANSDEDAQALAERKKKKQEKRRQKEERQHHIDINTAVVDSGSVAENPETLQRPTKRQGTSSPAHEGAEATHLLDFPTFGFGQSRSLDQYEILNSIEEGSYGYVSRARGKASGDIVALKRLKLDHNNDGFPVTGLREIQTLRACSHLHIVKLREVVASSGPTQE